MIELNLIPDVKRELLKAQRQRNAVISIAIMAAIAAGAVVVLMWLYVYPTQTLWMNTENKAITEQYTKLSSIEDLDKMLTIQNQLGAVSSLNNGKNITSRLYDVLNVIVPTDPHKITISSVTAELSDSNATSSTASGDSASAASGVIVTIEGQTTGSYSSLEVFEKMIAAAVIEYKPVEGFDDKGTMNCGTKGYECKYLVEGGGDRSTAVTENETSYGDTQDGSKALYFSISFTLAPEVLSNQVTDVRLKIGQNGNVTDSYLGVPRAIFEPRNEKESSNGSN